MPERTKPERSETGTVLARPAGGISLMNRPPGRVLHLEGRGDGPALADFLRALRLDSLPGPGRSAGHASVRLLAAGPDHWLLIADRGEDFPDDSLLLRAFAVALDLSHGWSRIVISGRHSADLLAKGCALDLHPRAFPAGACAVTGLAGFRIIIVRGPEIRQFDLFVGRSHMSSLREWLMDAAVSFGPDPTRTEDQPAEDESR